MSLRVISFLPVYNQEAQIGWVLERFESVLRQGTVQEVVAVDDGSTDRSPEILRSPPLLHVITHPERRGIGNAIRSAYRYALEHDYDVFVIMAGNGKDDPRRSRRPRPVLRDDADYVQGSRFCEGGRSSGLPAHRNVAIRVFTLTFSLFVGRRFTDCTNGFRAYRTDPSR